MKRFLRGWLVALVALPAVTVLWGFEGSRYVFTLYREPKLIAIGLLGWTFLALFFWHRRRSPIVEDLTRVLERPAMLALFAFLGWMTLTGLWVGVRANYLYELQQLLLLGLLLTTLLVWSAEEPRVARLVENGLLASVALHTAVGLVQWIVPMPWLPPINPQIGAPHPSLMGYKNPAALAVLGQIFLVAFRAFAARGRRRLGWSLVLAAELVYLASLGSRTSYAAFAVAALALVALFAMRRPREARRHLPAMAAALLLFVAVLFLHRPAGERMMRLVELASEPLAWLETDRGTYARNTWHMARLNPLGVGLGDWQTQYPVYRLYNRDWAFNHEFQVRRAHGDHVQTLGEGGFPGLISWLLFLALLLAAAIRRPDPSAYFLTAQLVALVVAMMGDYLLELPYHKFQFFLVVFLALQAADRPSRAPLPGQAGARRDGTRPSRRSLVAALTVILLALVHVVHHLALARKIHLAADLERAYLHGLALRQESGGTAAALARAELERAVAAGRHLAALPGHVKTLHRSYFLLGHAEWLLGRPEEARRATLKGLSLYPYSPNGLRLMGRLAEDPREARRWQEAHRLVMESVTDGWPSTANYGKIPFSGEGHDE